MAGTASIRIDQPANPTTPIGQPGRARDDLLLALPVTLRNADDTDVVRWLWTLLDKPLSSTAVLSSTTAPQVTLTPDVEGSYLVRLAVNDGLTGQIDTKVAAVRTSLGVRYPATGETTSSVNWPANDEKGWGKDAEQALRGLARPQLLEATGSELVPGAVLSTVVGVGGLGLPTNLAQIVDYEFVDLQGAIGGPPVVSSWTFTTITTGNKSINALQADLDSTACLAGDRWALVIGMADVGDILVLRVEII